LKSRTQIQVFLNCYFGFVSAFLLFGFAITDYMPRAHVSAQKQLIYFWGSIVVLALALSIALLARKPLGFGKFSALILPGALIMAIMIWAVVLRS
jgi:uncharacterized membrane protein SirB2